VLSDCSESVLLMLQQVCPSSSGRRALQMCCPDCTPPRALVLRQTPAPGGGGRRGPSISPRHHDHERPDEQERSTRVSSFARCRELMRWCEARELLIGAHYSFTIGGFIGNFRNRFGWNLKEKSVLDVEKRNRFGKERKIQCKTNCWCWETARTARQRELSQ
jgi:hypothetical protein